MSLVKFDQNRLFPRLSSLEDNFFGQDWFSDFSLARGTKMPAVNIQEMPEAFAVSVAAPGLDKADFNVELHNGVLSISTKKEEKKEEKDAQYTRREFSYQTFKRSFALPDAVDADNIKAKYEAGILNLTLPKKQSFQADTHKQIQIS